MAWKKIYEEIEKQTDESTEKKLKAVDKTITGQTKVAEAKIESQKKALPEEYKPLYDASEVQKIVDRRNIMNRMANTGATNSGLSDSLSAAVELSAGNRAQALNAQQRAALDKLSQSLIELQTSARNEIASRQSDIQSEADRYLTSTKGSLYNTYMQTEADKEKTRQQAATAQAKLQQELQIKTVEAQRNLVSNLAGGKITIEQYNAVAPSLGLKPITTAPQSSSATGGVITNPDGTQSTVIKRADGTLDTGYTSDAIRSGNSVKKQMQSGAISADEAIDMIIRAYEDYNNADAMIELAVKTAGLSALLQNPNRLK